MIKYAQVQALRKRAVDDWETETKVRNAEFNGYARGFKDSRDDMITSMALGAPIGSTVGTLASSFFIKDKMTPAKKLAIMLAGAGVGAAAGAGIGGATRLVLDYV